MPLPDWRFSWQLVAVLLLGCGRTPGRVAPDASASTTPPTITIAPSAPSTESTIPTRGSTSSTADDDAEHSVVQVAAGIDTTCALTKRGTVYCWGYNKFGQLGDGTKEDRTRPVRLKVERAVEIALGDFFGCARLDDGGIACWGDRKLGAIGDGKSEGSAEPTRLHEFDNLQELSRGLSSTCVVRRDDAVWCWGHLPWQHEPAYAPVEVPVLKGWSHIVLGSTHVCALSPKGQVGCWWYDKKSGPQASTSFGSVGLALLAGIPTVRELSTSSDVTCGTVDSGDVYCWVGPSRDPYPWHGLKKPTRMPIKDVAHLSVGPMHLCALRKNQSIVCLGRSEFGALSAESTKRTYAAVNVDLADATGVAVGPEHTCALVEAGSVWCWGNNTHGQFGSGTVYAGNAPGPVRW